MEENPLQLVLVTNTFPCVPGDAQFVETEFRELCRHFSCTVIHVFDPGKGRVPLPEDVRVLYFSLHSPLWRSALCLLHPAFWGEVRRAAKGVPLKTLLMRCKGILSFEEKATRFIRFLKKQNIVKDSRGLFYTYWRAEPTLGLARARADFSGMKLVTRVHGCDYQIEQVPNWGGWQPFVSTVDQALNRMFFTGETARDYYCRTYGYEPDSEKYQVARMGAAPACARSAPAKDRLVLVSCSSLIPLKRVDRIVEALALLPEDISVEWRHIGDGPEWERIQRLAHDKLDGRTNIRYFLEGYLPHDTVCAHVVDRHGELMLTASESEGLPVSIQEMFSIGIPAVATDVGGMRELVRDGETGFLVSGDGSPEALRDGILRYWRLSDGEKRTMSDKAFALWQENYQAEENARIFSRTLQRLCGKEG